MNLEDALTEVQRTKLELDREQADLDRRKAESSIVERFILERLGRKVPAQLVISQSSQVQAMPYASLKQVDAAAEVLRSAGRPMRTPDIAAALIAGGFPMTDIKRLKVSLFTSMMRKPTVFEKVGSGMWTLRVAASTPESNA